MAATITSLPLPNLTPQAFTNYFHYVRDPWGSFAEYSCDIDYIPKSQQWVAGNHAPEDSLSLWGPEPPDYFIANHEGATELQA